MPKTIICKDVFGNEYERSVEELSQTIRVYALIENDDQILLPKQWDGYSIAGGGVDKGESLEEALLREVKEETGLDVEVGDIFYQTSRFFQRDKKSSPKQAFMFYFKCKYLGGEINRGAITESEESYTGGLAEWVDKKELNTIIFRHSVELSEILKQYN